MSNIRVEDERRSALLDAALEVFARYGYRKTSMDEVARVAGALAATSIGLKVLNATRSSYLDGVRTAARLVCAPLI